MYFRPLSVLTAVTVPCLAILASLGVWQLQRADWKRELTAGFEAALVEQPASLDEALCNADGPRIGGIVRAADIMLETSEIAPPRFRVFGHAPTGAPGWRLVSAIPAPSCMPDGGRVLAQTGFEPLPGQISASAGDVTADRFLVDEAPRKPAMAAPNDPDANTWHWFDIAAMNDAIGSPGIDSRVMLVPLSGLPSYLSRTPPERHIGYAVTWFGIMAALFGVYLGLHVRAGRLGAGGPH
jgi:surfeit locus 1 family protein